MSANPPNPMYVEMPQKDWRTVSGRGILANPRPPKLFPFSNRPRPFHPMNHPESEMSDDLITPVQAPAVGEVFRMPPQEGYQGTPEEIEQQWLEQAYTGRGDRMPQLTFRATLLGCLLGGVMAVPNLYLGLKSGVLMGVGLTCTLMGFVVWQMLAKTRLVRGKLTVLEYNAMSSTASAAGYTTVGVQVSTIAAFILINDKPMPAGWLIAWVMCVAVLGVTMAIPMKRQIINVEQLPFPGSIAGAETLQLLVAESKSSVRSASALVLAAAAGAADTVWGKLGEIADRMVKSHLLSEAQAKFIGKFSSSYGVEKLNEWTVPELWRARTVMWAWDTMFFASGAFMGLRMCATLLVSGTLCWAVYVPLMTQAGHIHGRDGHDPVLRDFFQYTLWGAASCMIVSGLVMVAFQWRAFVKAVRSLGTLFGAKQARDQAQSPMAAIEAPMSWFFIGQVLAGGGLAFIGERVAGIPWWQTLLAVALSFLLSLITCRICGETSSPPNSAMAKVTQFTFGAMNPVNDGMTGAQKAGAMNINLLAAGITTGAACNAADLLSDLKTGYYLGAHPRKQFLAQFLGIFAGAVVSVVVFTALVPNKAALEGKDVFMASIGGGESLATWTLPAVLEARVQKGADGKAFIPMDAEVGAAMAKDGIATDGLPARMDLETKHIEPKFPAPSAWAWKGIAEAVAGGWNKMPEPKRWTMLCGAFVGLLLSVLPKLFPKSASWMPSAGVVATGWLFMWYMSLLMFMGSLATWIWQKKAKSSADALLIPVASGLFVGGSLMSVGVSFFTDGADMWKALVAAFAG